MNAPFCKWLVREVAFCVRCMKWHAWGARQVLCASNAAHDQVDPVNPPDGAAIGERITFEGFAGEPEPVLNPKKKIFEKLAPDLQTNAGALPWALLTL